MEKQEKIIDPIPKRELESDLKKSHLLCETYFGNQLFLADSKETPSIMREIGRLREESFRASGGGTGKSYDIDEYDPYFNQLILWNSRQKDIEGGYRIGKMNDLHVAGKIHSPTLKYFDYSDQFMKKYLPHTFELGRSFISLKYQPGPKGLPEARYALPSLFEGLGAIALQYPDGYLFGKVTLYPDYNEEAKKLIVLFLKKRYADKDGLLTPKLEFAIPDIEKNIEVLEKALARHSMKDDLEMLEGAIAEIAQQQKVLINIPPLVGGYLRLASMIKYFGIVKIPECGEQEELGMLIKVKDIKPGYMKFYTKRYKNLLGLVKVFKKLGI